MLPNDDSSENGHTKRRDIIRTVLDMYIRGKRLAGRPHIRLMDSIRRDMKAYGLDDQMTQDRKVFLVMSSRELILGLTQEWFGQLSFSRLECGVYDTLHIYPRCEIF